MDDNPFLKDNFRPVREEIATGPLTVTGSVPDHLDGRYLRIGPNPIAEVDPDHYHWFLGDGMVHGVRLRGGQAARPSGTATVTSVRRTRPAGSANRRRTTRPRWASTPRRTPT